MSYLLGRLKDLASHEAFSLPVDCGRLVDVREGTPDGRQEDQTYQPTGSEFIPGNAIGIRNYSARNTATLV